MAKDYRVFAISGPSKQEQEVFSWPERSTVPKEGLPERWDFDWVEMSLNNFVTTLEDW